ncbi:MAG: protein translocase subunit SecF [Clostridiales Family XIII bacterium]|jgi:SecD/SecF fusion protein|nr:protein translocase subunit SecF [Clostridiales Family XIII bacterium]
MIKKIGALLIIAIIVFAWIVTIRGVGPVGPIQKDIKTGLDISGGVNVVLEAQTQDITDEADLDRIMKQTQAVIERRSNVMGLSETVVTIEGKNKIRVEMPGAENAEEAIETIGQVAQLKFLTADGKEMLNGSDIKDSGVERDQNTAGYVVTLKFTKEGGEKFYQATSIASASSIPAEDVMQPVQTVAEDATAEPAADAAATDPDAPATPSTPVDIDYSRVQDKEGNIYRNPAGFGLSANQVIIVLDDEIISAPSASEPINGTDAIIESFTQDRAKELSQLIRGGALPVELKEVESSQVSATLGIDALKDSILAGIIGIALIFLLMLVAYRLLGFCANIALMLYIPALLWILVALKGVLTLPGIAGIILSIGMAVDTNVIIFARVKEEVGNGKTIRVAASHGFRRALGTVIDAQLTTLIAGLVLYQFGTGPVKGFALTLIIGIILGIVTAIIVTNLFTNVCIETKALAKPFLIGVKEGQADQHTQLKHKFDYLKRRKLYYIITLVILIGGIGLGLLRGYNWGIDFTGGTMVQVDMGKVVTTEQMQDTLKKNDIEGSSIQHYDTDSGADNGVIIKTTKALSAKEVEKLYDSLTSEYKLKEGAEKNYQQFGPSIGDALKKNAVIAVLIAALGMLIYIVIRFRWRFGVAAIVAEFHDVFMMIALYGIFHFSVNNPFIAAILTIVGYSINDTIVIFDRIRENLGLMSRKPLYEIVNTSVDQTLIRSLMTSFSTMLAVLPLVIFGGTTIREFAVPLMIGIICGAASSIFIASPIFYELNRIGGKNGKRSRYSASLKQTNAKETGYGAKGKGKQSKSKRRGPYDGAVV